MLCGEKRDKRSYKYRIGQVVVLRLSQFLLLVTKVSVVPHDLFSIQSVCSFTKQLPIYFCDLPRCVHRHTTAHAPLEIKSFIKLILR